MNKAAETFLAKVKSMVGDCPVFTIGEIMGVPYKDTQRVFYCKVSIQQLAALSLRPDCDESGDDLVYFVSGNRSCYFGVYTPVMEAMKVAALIQNDD